MTCGGTDLFPVASGHVPTSNGAGRVSAFTLSWRPPAAMVACQNAPPQRPSPSEQNGDNEVRPWFDPANEQQRALPLDYCPNSANGEVVLTPRTAPRQMATQIQVIKGGASARKKADPSPSRRCQRPSSLPGLAHRCKFPDKSESTVTFFRTKVAPVRLIPILQRLAYSTLPSVGHKLGQD